MAAIEKIYGTPAQWDQLNRWLRAKGRVRPIGILKRMYKRQEGSVIPIAHFTYGDDAWLWKMCPFAWIEEAIRWQYLDAEDDFGKRGPIRRNGKKP